MKVVLLRILDSIRTSYWFIPTLMAAASLVLSWVMVSIDRAGPAWLENHGWIYSGGPEGAREVLSTIASSMITVAGVVFSITIVALTLASQQFGPRLLYSFMRDRGNQFVLGTFIATFLYCLLTLRTIYGEGENVESFVPHLATSVGVALAACSIGVLIYFIHHVSISIQAPHVIASVTGDLHRGIASLEGHFSGRDASTKEVEEIEKGLRGILLEEKTAIQSEEEGYILAIDHGRLMDLACEHDLLISLSSRPGLYIQMGETLATAAPSLRVRPDVRARIADAIALGSRRTALQDVEFSIDQLAEVAVRALSPGINDPYTAATCVDHIGAGLLHIMKAGLPSPYRMDDQGRPRIILERPLTFAGVADASLHQVRQHIGESVSVTIRALDMIASLVQQAPDAEHMDVLRHHAILLHRQGRKCTPEQWDAEDLDARLDRVAANIEARGLPGAPRP